MSAMRLRLVASFGTPSSPLPSYMGLSILAHITFLAALVLAPSFRSPRPFPDNPMVVNLVAASSPAVSVPSPVAPPTPAVEAPPPEGVRIETKQPKRSPLPEKPRKKPEPKPEPPPSRPVVTQPSRSPAPGEATEASPGASIAVLEAGDVEFAWYRASVTAALFSHWRRPILEGSFDAYEVGIGFEIRRDGTVSNLRIESTSGVPSLDRSALRAVSDAAPLPALPSTWRRSELPARYVFRLLPE